MLVSFLDFACQTSLSGEKKASEIPIKVFNEDLSTYINKTTADTIGITIPDDIANGEKTVYFD